MKFVVEKDKLLKAVSSVAKAVAVRTTTPILEGILIQTNDNNDIKLTCFTHGFHNIMWITNQLFP